VSYRSENGRGFAGGTVPTLEEVGSVTSRRRLSAVALSVALTVSLALGVAAQELPPEQPPQEGIIPAGGDLSTEDIIVPSSQDEVSELTVEYTAPDARRFVFVVITDEPVGEPPVDLSTVRGAEEVVPGSSGAVDVPLNFQKGGGPTLKTVRHTSTCLPTRAVCTETNPAI
jgi:hypothetical protein